jgi:hypothetical protein
MAIHFTIERGGHIYKARADGATPFDPVSLCVPFTGRGFGLRRRRSGNRKGQADAGRVGSPHLDWPALCRLGEARAEIEVGSH